MIPYFELRVLPVAGGFSLPAFGILVAVGVLAGVRFADVRARRVGIKQEEINAAIVWAVVPGFFAAHLVSLFAYDNASANWRWSDLLEFWRSMSSFGGFAGAFVGLSLGFSRRSPAVRLTVAEVLLQALVVGWAFGRLGCTLVHDHVGRPSDFWLAVRFPDGARHDLGFYEWLFTVLVLVPALVVLNRKPRPPGATVAGIALLYAPARFLGDFLRNTDLPGADVRYFGLTFAQYACIVLACVGLAFARRAAEASREKRGLTPFPQD